VLHALLETALERQAEIVLVQEPPTNQTYLHPGYQLTWNSKTLLATKKDSRWKTRLRAEPVNTEGYIQVIDLERKGHLGVRLVNIYDQVNRNTGKRPAREIDLAQTVRENTVLAGDFNAHGRRWNDYLNNNEERNAGWVKTAMDAHDLKYIGDREATYIAPNSEIHSVIDLTLCTEDIAERTRAETLTDP